MEVAKERQNQQWFTKTVIGKNLEIESAAILRSRFKAFTNIW
jgi:hypothetical protein